MAQAGFTPIQLYRTTTASAQPSAGNLAAGELAINLTDKKLYAKDASNNVFLLADASSGGTTAANLAGGAAGSLPYQSGANATTFLGIGAANRVLTSSGTAPQWVTSLTGLTGVSSSSITNTSLTATRLVYSTTGGAQTDSANLTFDGTSLTINGSPNLILSSSGIERGRIVTGTGAVELMAGSTTTPTISMASNVATFTNNPVLSGGTANGVLYLDGSKVATSGSALTFDGTNLAVGISSSATYKARIYGGNGKTLLLDNDTSQYTELWFANNGTTKSVLGFNNISGDFAVLNTNTGGALLLGVNGSEQMRLTSTGLGIGTNSPAYKLDVAGAANLGGNIQTISGSTFYNSTGDLYIRAGTSGALRLGSGGANDRLYLDSSGNLGLGVTPSAWFSGYTALQIPAGSFSGFQTATLIIQQNSFFSAATSDNRYVNNGFAGQYTMVSGQHRWLTAPSGTAGNPISFTQAMTLDASGNLAVGTSSTITAANTTNVQIYGSSIANLRLQNGTSGVTSSDGFLLQSAGNDVYVWNLENSFISLGTNNTERARITSGGDLLVGTAANAGGTRLKSKVAAGTAGFEVTDEVQSDFIVTPLSGAVCRVGPSAGAMAFYSANSERARVTSGGDLLVGTQSGAGERLRVTCSANNQALYTENTNATANGTIGGIYINYTGAAPNSTGFDFLRGDDTGANRFSMRSNGGLANYQSNNVDLSDARTKKDIAPAPSYWGKIGALEIVTYKYKDQTHDDVNVGVIAQQVEQVEPVWVDSDGFGETPEDGIPLKTVYTKDITFAAIKALQEAMARIEQLEARLAAAGI